MGKLTDGDDGLPAEEVGVWAKEKHNYLCRYIDISRSTRAKYLGPGKAGATYVDLFCGPGRCKVRDSNEWIDGGVVAAWKIEPRRQCTDVDTPSIRHMNPIFHIPLPQSVRRELYARIQRCASDSDALRRMGTPPSCR